MTHAELVKLAERWLRKSPDPHPIVLSDVRCNMISEQPDAIGFRNGGGATVVECKASRADYIRDLDKPHRKNPAFGMGAHRYYCAPAGVIPVDNALFPKGWGLIVPTERGVRVILKADPFKEFDQNGERALLVYALRCATEGWGRRIFGDEAPPLVDGDPHPTASAIIRELRHVNLKLRRQLQNLGAVPVTDVRPEIDGPKVSP